MIRPLTRLALGAAATALIVSSAACGKSASTDKGSPKPTASTGQSPTGSPSATVGTASGKTAQNAKYLWTASTVEYAPSVPDSDGKVQKPFQGAGYRYCLVTTTVKNLSSEDQDLAALDYSAIDATGAETTASGFLTGEADFPFATQTSLSPGDERTVKMAFEVSVNVAVTTLVVGGDFTKPGTGIKIELG